MTNREDEQAKTNVLELLTEVAKKHPGATVEQVLEARGGAKSEDERLALELLSEIVKEQPHATVEEVVEALQGRNRGEQAQVS